MSNISTAGPTTTTVPPPSSPSSLFTRANLHTQTLTLVAKRRPWRHFFDYTTISIPTTYEHTITTIKQNLNYFRVNYAMVMLLILFLALVYHPVSIIVFLVMFVGWLFIYFLRDPRTPVMFFNRVVDDRVVVVGLSLLTFVVLAFSGVGVNVLVGLVVVVVVVGLHAAVRSPDDLFLDEDEAAEGGLVSVVGSDSRSTYGFN